MGDWTPRAKLAWGVVVCAAIASITATLAFGSQSPMAPPVEPLDWLILAVIFGLAVYLGLRPIQTAPDRRLTAASAPVIALPLLFDPLTAILAGSGAMAVTQAVRHAPWHVTVFNLSQRTIGIALTSLVCGALTLLLGLPPFIPCAVASVAYFATNTVCVSAISAARKRVRWPLVWWTMVREQWLGEAGLLAGGVLVAVHVHSAPLAVPLLAPPLWMAWRVLVNAAEIRRLNQSLQAALDTQRRFLADASHELRTPIASLRAQLESLRGQVGSAPAVDVREQLDEMARETSRIGALLADLLALARADSGVPVGREPVSLEDVLLDVYRELRPLAGEVNLSVQLSDEAPTLMGDRERLRQLILNLGANALRFTPAGGDVRIGCAADATHACIEVVDTGSGIAPEDLPHIFDRFYRAERGRARGREGPPGGSGLGLSIAKWVAEAHGGTISVESQVGTGSTFTVTLPLAPPPPLGEGRGEGSPKSAARAATAGAR